MRTELGEGEGSEDHLSSEIVVVSGGSLLVLFVQVWVTLVFLFGAVQDFGDYVEGQDFWYHRQSERSHAENEQNVQLFLGISNCHEGEIRVEIEQIELSQEDFTRSLAINDRQLNEILLFNFVTVKILEF